MSKSLTSPRVLDAGEGGKRRPDASYTAWATVCARARLRQTGFRACAFNGFAYIVPLSGIARFARTLLRFMIIEFNCMAGRWWLVGASSWFCWEKERNYRVFVVVVGRTEFFFQISILCNTNCCICSRYGFYESLYYSSSSNCSIRIRMYSRGYNNL